MNANVFNEINKSSLVNFNHSVFNYFYGMMSVEEVAELFLDSCSLKAVNAGSKYASTPLGALFNLSILPKLPMGTYEYFSNPMDQVCINCAFSFYLKSVVHIGYDISSRYRYKLYPVC